MSLNTSININYQLKKPEFENEIVNQSKETPPNGLEAVISAIQGLQQQMLANFQVINNKMDLHEKKIGLLEEKCLKEGFYQDPFPLTLEQMKLFISTNDLSKVVKDDKTFITGIITKHKEAINFKDKKGKNLLHHAISEQNLDLIKLFLTHGADVELCSDEESPLMKSYDLDNFDMFKLFVEHKADLISTFSNTSKGWKDFTLLHKAVIDGHIEYVKILLAPENKINIDQVMEFEGENYTALCFAARIGFPKIGRLLLEAGADPELKMDEKGKTAITIAREYDSMEFFLEILEFAIEKGNTALVDKMTQEINQIDGEGNSLLHRAISYHSSSIVNRLLNHKADINLLCNLQSPLLRAYRSSKFQIFKLLIEKGAKLGTLYNDQSSGWQAFTLLHSAAYFSEKEVVKIILEKYLDNIDEKMKSNGTVLDNYTALCLAAEKNHVEIGRLLLGAGADPELKINEKGTTALTIAKAKNHAEFTALLSEHIAMKNPVIEEKKPTLTEIKEQVIEEKEPQLLAETKKQKKGSKSIWGTLLKTFKPQKTKITFTELSKEDVPLLENEIDLKPIYIDHQANKKKAKASELPA